MTQEILNYTVSDMERLATAIAKSKLFGMQTADQALALMAIAQAEGLHPAIAARDYHIVQGRPTLKADAMLARFQGAGGKVEWTSYCDDKCEAIFSHPQGGTVTVMWDMVRVKKAEISNAAMYKKYPRNMLRARVISEGIRTIYPGVLIGTYTPEEAADFDPPKSAIAQWAETPPVTIEQQFDWSGWAKHFAGEIKAAETSDDVIFLATGEKEKLEEFKKLFPDSHKRMMDLIAERETLLQKSGE